MIVLATFCLSVLLGWVYCRLAVSLRLLDTPNERSSHARPTPSGGGVAIMLALLLGLLFTQWLTPANAEQYLVSPYGAMLVAALLLCLLGVFDDLRGLSITLRFSVYGVVCVGMAWLLLGGGRFGDGLVSAGLVLFVAFTMLWLLNLYNFMDGIDGIAALQTVSVTGSAAALAWHSGATPQYIEFLLLLGAAHAGFLVLNWPPARLFMGDAGSVATGFLLGCLAVLGTVRGELNPLCWFILLGIFVVDATWTLLRRMLSGEPFTQPHRSHAYQRLSRHFGSHRAVDFLLLAVNLGWLLPLAYAAMTWPQHGLFLVILAYLPLLAGMAKIGRFP